MNVFCSDLVLSYVTFQLPIWLDLMILDFDLLLTAIQNVASVCDDKKSLCTIANEPFKFCITKKLIFNFSQNIYSFNN